MPAPSDIFAGYTYADDKVQIPIADLPVLTAAEANATTGDVRELARAFIEALTVAIEGMEAAEKPRFMTISRGNIVGVSPGVMRRSFVITFEEQVSAAATSIRPEP